jgi:2-keto-4-pentenoate hydratase/2-oxohepta-3-ene-1,7-dioic acid hydratase in catechol pathway
VRRVYARARFGSHIVFGELFGDVLKVESADGHGLAPKNGTHIPLEELSLLPPVAPGKIVAVALNYRAHAAEMKKPVPEEPMFFMKPSSAIIGDEGVIVLPPDSADVQHEGELGIVLNRPLKNATPEEARSAVLGYTCVNDVTARDIQRKQNHYTRAKGYDTFCPVGPFVVAGIEIEDLRIRLRVNGEVRQDGRTSDMIFGPWKLLSFISHIMTLQPGDLVSTGTPPGVGTLRAGDHVEVEIDDVGILRNQVAAAPAKASAP